MRWMLNIETSRDAAYAVGVLVGLLALVVWAPLDGARAQPDEAQWNLQVANVHNLYAVDVTLGFDASVVEVVDAEPDRAGIQVIPGPLFTGQQYFVVYNRVMIDEETRTGSVEFVATLLNPSEPVDGAGTVAVIPYRVLDPEAAGGTPFEIQEASLAAHGGESMAIRWEANTIWQVDPFRLHLPLIMRNSGTALTGAQVGLDERTRVEIDGMMPQPEDVRFAEESSGPQGPAVPGYWFDRSLPWME